MADRTPKNPAAGTAPVSRRAARASVPGGPAASEPPYGAAGGKTSPPAQSPQAPAPEVTPGPETARPGPAAVRAGDQNPAGGEPSVPSSPPAGSTALSGEEWRKEVKRATSAQHAEARRRATRYVPRSRKGVQAASGPGMVRRMPPPLPPDGAA